jgi:hypothetical protein
MKLRFLIGRPLALTAAALGFVLTPADSVQAKPWIGLDGIPHRSTPSAKGTTFLRPC